MSDDIEFTYQVDDGYAGGSRPQGASIWAQDCEGMSRDEIEDYISEVVEEHFRANISWVCDISDVADKIEEALSGGEQ